MPKALNRQAKNEALRRLEATYEHGRCALEFANAFELLIATILSAQCTDAQVNMVTPRLFQDYPTPQAMAALSEAELEPYIKSCGFFRMKGKHIIATCQKLLTDFGGDVPAEMDKLLTLPGVGRKTANVVLSNAFGVPAIAVDTHVFRVSNRIGLTRAKDELATEQQLMALAPKDDWGALHHWLIWHGRLVCHARKPECGGCVLVDICGYTLDRLSEIPQPSP